MGTGDVTDPIGLLRIASMVKKVEDQLESLELDDSVAARLDAIAGDVRQDLSHAISPELSAELDRLMPRADAGQGRPTPAEAVIAHTQLAGWIDGVVQ